MHPLTRQPTLDSVLSWWSDSNPVGPNINLHAAAKPLMRFLYHRDALAYIRKHLGTPLSKETMEIYSSYLGYKYVSSSTKSAILMDLQTRVKFEDEARTVADSLVLYLCQELAGSLDAEVRRRICGMLEGLARHETTVPAVLSVNPCQPLVSLLRGGNLAVVECAAQALYRITFWTEGAQAAVAANVLEYMAELLSSPHASVQEWMCLILGKLAHHQTTLPAVLSMNPCQPLVSLLHGGNLAVIASAAQALYRITITPEGAQAAVDANVVEYTAELLSSPNASVRDWTHDILEELMLIQVSGGDPTVIESVAQALYRITISSEGVQAAVDANVLEYGAQLLSSPQPSVRGWTREILGKLVRHEATTSLAVGQLVSLLRGGDSTVIQSAVQALYRITISPQGAQAAVDANVLEYTAELLSSPNASVREWMRNILGELVRHEATANPAAGQLVSLLRGGNPTVIENVAQTLYQIYQSPETAQAAKVLECVAELLLSPNASLRGWPREMLRQLARHKTAVSPAAGKMISPSRGGNLAVIESAGKTLTPVIANFRHI
ncbi:armadillo-type protein [Mycena capillaripes]|nr:armadillo-type protein [Mycena capillaripes]